MYYPDTMQQRALRLMASTLAAATMIEGQLSDEGLAAMSECEDMTAQLAKELMNGIKDNVADLTACFKQIAVKNGQGSVRKAEETKEPAALKLVRPETAAENGWTNVQLSLFDLLAS